MATPQIPKYNNSLKAFTKFVDNATLVGVLGAILGIFVAFANSVIGFVIIYFGTLALALGLIARFLRQTALIIVEGLGGTIELDFTPATKLFNIDQFRQGAKDGWSEEELSGLLPKNFYDAWIKNYKPSLKSFADSKQDSFFDWLLSQKGK